MFKLHVLQFYFNCNKKKNIVHIKKTFKIRPLKKLTPVPETGIICPAYMEGKYCVKEKYKYCINWITLDTEHTIKYQ